MTTSSSLRHAARFVLVLVTMAVAVARPAAEKETTERDLGADRFIAGGFARVDKPVPGDLIAAGGEVQVDAPVRGDAILFGGRVQLDGEVGNDIYAAGGRLNVEGAVGRNVRIAGGRVELGPKSSVTGNVTVAGGNVRIRGTVRGYVQIAGGQVFIDGPVEGDVEAATGHLTLGPNARIKGQLRYSGDELERDAAAKVGGGIERFGLRGDKRREATESAGGWLWTAGLMVLAMLFAGAFPATSRRVSRDFRTHPGFALLFGFIAFVCLPVAAIILMITIIGLPLGLLAILTYLALLLVGYVAGAVAFADAALERWRPGAAASTAWRIAAAVLVILAISLLHRVPYAGNIVMLAAILAGVGAIVLSLRPGARPQ